MQLGWVDFSKADREKVLDVINYLQEQGAVDEIGIGLIRDGFANYFFPGTSTVQTRAKYFFIVPYILQEAVSGKYGDQVNVILQKIDAEEKNCGILLYQKCMKEGIRPIGTGIIGARVLPQNWVARKPSNIYWNGIRTFHIFEQENMSISDMVRLSAILRAQGKPEKLGNRRDNAEEGEQDDRDAGRGETIRFFDLPEMRDKEWRSHLDISLTDYEAQFLRSKIEKSVPDSLLAYILKNNIDVSKYDRFEVLYEAKKNDVPAEMAGMMKLACDFNRLVYAARVRCNVILSRGLNKDTISEWEQIESDMDRYTDVDLPSVLTILRRPDPKLRRFLFDLQNAFRSMNLSDADKCIIDREKNIKTLPRAKLCHAEDFDPDNWVGGRYLDYRFGDAKRIVSDIYDGEGAVHVSD